jgi:menaquinone-dependent protoporphyrinogen oxidase
MKPVAILYATCEGQTRKIAGHIAEALRKRGLRTVLSNVKDAAGTDLRSYSAAILAASVHAGRHEREMLRFVKLNRSELNKLPTAFVSVTLSQAGVEKPSASAVERSLFTAGVAGVIDEFIHETGWRPTHIKPVAGALLYTKYNPLIRFVMKRIAKKAGAETDTSRDYEYTDWVELDRFTGTLASELAAGVNNQLAPAECSLDPHCKNECANCSLP